MSQAIYFQIYEILLKYLYGADAILTPEMQLSLTQLSTFLSLFVVLLPFLIVLLIVKAVFK